jgi:hypothetical protein
MTIGSVRSLRKIAVGIGALAIACGAVPAVGGDIQTTNNGGGSTNPNPGSVVDVSWNPDNECVVGESETLAELLGCMASYIDPIFFCDPVNPVPGGAQLPPGYAKESIYPGDHCPEPDARGDFVVHYIGNPPIGVTVQRLAPDETGSMEPEKLFIHENDPNIQWVTISVNRPSLTGRFGVVTEVAHGGSITLAVNGTPLPAVTTTNGEWSVTVNRALVSRLTQAGYNVFNDGTYLIVSTPSPGSITSISWKSTDSGIVRSTLHLDTGPPPQPQLDGE